MRIILHPTWDCQLSCPYCSVHAMHLEQNATQLAWRDWLSWLRGLPRGSSIEISGGEPLVYAGIVPLIQWIADHGLSWGLTTNGVNVYALDRLAKARIPNCLALNVSAQPQVAPEVTRRACEIVQAGGYPLHINWVEHPDAPAIPEGAPLNRIPYQAWAEGEAVDGVKRYCNAGVEHLCTDPAGNLYRCLVALQTGQAPLGTIREPLGAVRRAEATACTFGCSSCYTRDPGGWAVAMYHAQEEPCEHS